MAQTTFIARQPIFDRRLRVVAYELLYRNGPENRAIFDDASQAAAHTLVASICELGLDRVAQGRRCFVNVTQELLLSGLCHALPRGDLVVEILETARPSAELVAQAEGLRKAGFRLALDDFVYSPAWEPLAQMADYIKVDIRGVDRSELARQAEQLRRYPARLLAEKVESRAELEYCRSLGFELFQGFFLCRPELLQGKTIPRSIAAGLDLLSLANDPEVDFARLQEAISRDAGLSYKLLRFLNSAAVGLSRPVTSIQHALVLAGLRHLRSWLSIIALAGMEFQPRELLTLALVRSHMMQRMAIAAGRPRPQMFATAGLLSTIDAMVGREMSELVSSLPLSEDLARALCERSGDLGQALTCAIAYERGDWSEAAWGGLDEATLTQAYLASVVAAKGSSSAAASGTSCASAQLHADGGPQQPFRRTP